MKIGIIADTHDNMPMITKAVELFNDRGVDLVLHAGDFVAPFALRPLKKLKCDYVGVFGNNDGERLGLNKLSEGRIHVAPYSLEFDSKKILLLHEPGELAALITSQTYDIIIYGHTHEPAVKTEGRTLAINPGECGGWLEGKATVAIADLGQMTAEIVELT